MAEADFPAIYREWTPAEVKHQHETATNNAFSEELNTALKQGDFKQAANVLTDAGACRWDALFPGGENQLYTNEGSKTFLAAYSFDKDTAKITINEEQNAGGGGFGRFMWMDNTKAFVPRLTISAEKCQDK